jgi:hypothetical protein
MMIGSLLIFLILPFVHTSLIRTNRFKFINKLLFYIFILNFILLMQLGGLPIEEPYTSISQISTGIYFGYFIATPILGLIENILFSINNIEPEDISNHTESGKLVNSTNLPKISVLTKVISFIKSINVKNKNYSTNKNFHILITIIFILTILNIIIYAGYSLIQTAFFFEKLKMLITSFNNFIENHIFSILFGDNTTVGELFGENMSTMPKSWKEKFMFAINLAYANHYKLYSLLVTYFILLGLWLLLLLALIVMKPSILKIMEPKGQELENKIESHKKIKNELNSQLEPLKKKRQLLIDLRTDNLSFIAAYRHSLNIWRLKHSMDVILGHTQSNMVQDVLISNQLNRFNKKLCKIMIFIYLGVTFLSLVLNMGVNYCLATVSLDASAAAETIYYMTIVEKVSLFVSQINILAGLLMILTFPYFITYSILFISNSLYNYKLFIVRNSPRNF